jgi:hypothetical protein
MEDKKEKMSSPWLTFLESEDIQLLASEVLGRISLTADAPKRDICI